MAKYDSLRKLTRNEALIKYAEENKDKNLSLKEIGKVFGISPSRVYRILKKAKSK